MIVNPGASTGKATIAEAVAGTNDTKFMTPAAVAQAAVSRTNNDTISGVKTFGNYRKSSKNSMVVYENIAELYTTSGSGTICITIPKSNVMFDMDVVYRGYGNNGVMNIQGYTYASNAAMYQPSAVGTFSGVQPTIRYANDANSNRCILIGTTSTNWGGYLHVTIPRMAVGYSSSSDVSGVQIQLLTSESGLTVTGTGVFNSGMKAYHVGSSAPANLGLLWIDTSTGTMKYHNGSAWTNVYSVWAT